MELPDSKLCKRQKVYDNKKNPEKNVNSRLLACSFFYVYDHLTQKALEEIGMMFYHLLADYHCEC